MGRNGCGRTVPWMVWVMAAVALALLVGLVVWRRSTVPSPMRVAREAVLDSMVMEAGEAGRPGATPCTILRYRHPDAASVSVIGSWDGWQAQTPLAREGGEWRLDVRELGLQVGYYAFRLVPDGTLQGDILRELAVAPGGRVARPSPEILSARLETPTRIDVVFSGAAPGDSEAPPRVVLYPDVPVGQVATVPGGGDPMRQGYRLAGAQVTFVLDASTIGDRVPTGAVVMVSGSFNGWSDEATEPWILPGGGPGGVRERTFALVDLHRLSRGRPLLFRYRLGNGQALPLPEGAPNVATNTAGELVLNLDPAAVTADGLRVETLQAVSVTNSSLVEVVYPGGDRFWAPLTIGAPQELPASIQTLGALRSEGGAAVFRVFAPRATAVSVVLGGAAADGSGAALRRNSDGTWESEALAVDNGGAYAYRVNGPAGPDEAFYPLDSAVDPYARAVSPDGTRGLVLEANATNAWFGGWRDDTFRPVAREDAVIYEVDVRDFTLHASSGVAEGERGTFAGLRATLGKGTGLAHLKQLGVNVIALTAIDEACRGTNAPCRGLPDGQLFAPDAVFGTDPSAGSQYYQFKALVDTLHAEGFAVLLDLELGRMASSSNLARFGRSYYLRQWPDGTPRAITGRGHDLRTEAAMVRRLAVDVVLYWMNEHHVDGFRLRQVELVDSDTLGAIREAARSINPDVWLIAVPGRLLHDDIDWLAGEGWSVRHPEYAASIVGFVRQQSDRKRLPALVTGSAGRWARTPVQAINSLGAYPFTASDRIAWSPAGKEPAPETLAARQRVAATLLFTSLGVPLLSPGEDFMARLQAAGSDPDAAWSGQPLDWQARREAWAGRLTEYYRQLIELRRSPQGAPFRWPAGRPMPPGYYRWIFSSDEHALAYIVNARRFHDPHTFVVAVSTFGWMAHVRVPFPPGKWMLVGDGSRISLGGLGEPFECVGAATERKISMKGWTSRIYLRVPD